MDEQEKRFLDLEILVNRISEKFNDLETEVKAYPEIHKMGCPFSDFKGDVVGKFREIGDGIEKCKGEIWAGIDNLRADTERARETLKKDLQKEITDTKTGFRNNLGVVTTVLVVLLGVMFTFSQDKVSTQSFHESITILNKTQERQIEIYERLLQDLNELKVDTGIIKNKIEDHVDGTKHGK